MLWLVNETQRGVMTRATDFYQPSFNAVQGVVGYTAMMALLGHCTNLNTLSMQWPKVLRAQRENELTASEFKKLKEAGLYLEALFKSGKAPKGRSCPADLKPFLKSHHVGGIPHRKSGTMPAKKKSSAKKTSPKKKAAKKSPAKKKTGAKKKAAKKSSKKK